MRTSVLAIFVALLACKQQFYAADKHMTEVGIVCFCSQKLHITVIEKKSMENMLVSKNL